MAASPLVTTSPLANESLDRDDDDPRSPHPLAWALPLVPVAASVFGMSALLYYKVQAGGEGPGQNLLQSSVAGVYHMLGFVPSFMLCILVLSWSSIWFITGRLATPWGRLLRVLTAAVALALLVNLGSTPNPDGGMLGHFLVPRLVRSLGFALTTVLVVATTVAAMLLATDFFFYRHFEALGREVAERTRSKVRLDPRFQDAGGSEPSAQDTALEFRSLDAAVGPEETLALDPTAFGLPEALRAAPEIVPEAAPVTVAEPLPEVAVTPAPPDETQRPGWRSRLRIRLDDIPPAVATADVAISDAPGFEPELAAVPELAPEPEVTAPLAPEENVVQIVAAADTEELGIAFGSEAHSEEAPVVLPTPQPVAEPESIPDLLSEPEPEPELAAQPAPEPVVEVPRAPEPALPRQGTLFGGAAEDEALIEEATALVVNHRRANAAFLRNRLRIRYEEAVDLLHALAQRGVVALDESGVQGRVLIDG